MRKRNTTKKKNAKYRIVDTVRYIRLFVWNTGRQKRKTGLRPSPRILTKLHIRVSLKFQKPQLN